MSYPTEPASLYSDGDMYSIFYYYMQIEENAILEPALSYIESGIAFSPIQY